MSAWQVGVERHRDQTLSNREDVTYRTPALSLPDARALVGVLLDVDLAELGDSPGPWETAIVGGRQVVTLTAVAEPQP